MKMLGNFFLFAGVYWRKILVFLFLITLTILSILFLHYCTTNYLNLESFSRRQLAGGMALYLPMFLLVQLLTLPAMFAIQYYLLHGLGGGRLEKGKVDKKGLNVKWADVIGMESAKKEAWEIIKLLQDKAFLKVVGGHIIKGTLFIGPPGCGKTYLAKAIATECGIPMISAVGSEFVGVLVGQGAGRMRSLFKQARNMAAMYGGCIIFIDEIDSFARPRLGHEQYGGGASMAHNATINQFLTELDGLRQKENNIVVLAATNVHEDELDPAILRSGRFDRKIHIEKPNVEERKLLYQFYLRKLVYEDALDLDTLAERSQAFSQADIANAVREAGILASRKNRTKVGMEDLWQAHEKISINISKTGRTQALLPKNKIRWSDVIGIDEAKAQAWELVKMLRDRHLIGTVGSKAIRCTLLIGPPGCGKTYLAKAMASEAGVPFLSVMGSELNDSYMSEGLKKMEKICGEARSLAMAEDACLLFIDEIDAFARAKGQFWANIPNPSLNKLLKEIDELKQNNINIVLLAATNVAEEALDPALLRSGRFDRKIELGKPNEKERKDLLDFFLTKIKSDSSINSQELAQKSIAFSPADLENMTHEASLIGLRGNRSLVSHEDMKIALEQVADAVRKRNTEVDMNPKVNIPWDSVIGMEETKKDAWEVVELLKDRNKLKVVGGQIIKGVLMVGPPGCGKTYLAKAMATEAGFPFLSAVGSQFIEKYVGVGAQRIRALFKEARNLAKADGGCIVFIDEIDSIARPRPTDVDNFGGPSEYAATTNQLLTELDGLSREQGNIIVLAATNVPEEALDPALMRSGRFDRKIYFQKPTTRGREELFRFYFSQVKIDKTVDIPALADKAKYFSAADISNAVKEAGIFALREKREIICMDDALKGVARVLSSVEKMGENKILGGKVNVKWAEVIGMTDAKEEAWEIVKLLKDRKLLKVIGGKIVKGVVMFGPPGCGKTYLAKAMATEAGYPFMSAAGSDLVGIYVGEGAKKMKDIFKEARAMANSEGGCIIFFDEIDSFATRRVQINEHGSGISHNATINQFLTELDGLRQQENNIVILAATNARESDLDPALLRAGRLERKIYVTLPTVEERKELLKFYFSKVNVGQDVDPERWARIAVGISPADIDNLVREAGLIALRENRDVITHKDLMLAYDRINIGALSKEKHTPGELLITAYHEAGHAILAYLVHPTHEVIKATIRARKGALGYVWYRDIEELKVSSPSREHWMADLQVGLAGYVAEKMSIGTSTTGVGGGPGSDFHKAMKIAHFMVWSLGMGHSGLIGDFTALEQGHISEKTREILDSDVQHILQDCLKKTTEILTQHKELLEHFAQELIKKGDLEYDEVQAIFNQLGLKPAASRPAENSPDQNPAPKPDV